MTRNLPLGGKQPRSSMGPVIGAPRRYPASVPAAAGPHLTTILQTPETTIDFGMSLAATLARAVLSQQLSHRRWPNPPSTTPPRTHADARPIRAAFPVPRAHTPIDHYPGDATALAILGRGRSEAIASPVSLEPAAAHWSWTLAIS